MTPRFEKLSHSLYECKYHKVNWPCVCSTNMNISANAIGVVSVGAGLLCEHGGLGMKRKSGCRSNGRRDANETTRPLNADRLTNL
jgi:hypothetical protein